MADPNRPVTGRPAANANRHPPSPRPPPPYSNTSYPHAAARPPNHHDSIQYNVAHQPDSEAVRRKIATCRVVLGVIAGFIILVTFTILLITASVLHRRPPEIRVDSLSISNYNLFNNQLTAFFQIGMTVRNPDSKIALDYRKIDVYVSSKGFQFVQTSLAPFTQPKLNVTSIKASGAVLNTYVGSDLASHMDGQRSKNGCVNFDVDILIRLKATAATLLTRRVYLSAFCGDLCVGISSNSSNGSLIGGPGQCYVV